MIIIREELFSKPASCYIVSTNGVVTRSSGKPKLVMGAGAALDMQDRFPGCSYDFGLDISSNGVRKSNPHGDATIYEYYGSANPRRGGPILGAFQVKYHWSDPAVLDLIRKATGWWVAYLKLHDPKEPVRMNYPGIGRGQLRREDIEPIISVLPDNVTVCIR